MMKFGDFLNIEKNNLIQINGATSYIIAGVQNYGKGILNKRNVKGSELTMKKYQVIKENQLMWCKVDTKNGAFGITRKEHADSLASTNMCLANIEIKKVLPDFLQLLFTLDWFYNWITEKSTGTTNRQYLTPPQILDLVEIPDFTISEQKEFIRQYNVFTNGGLSEELKFQQIHLQQLRQAILQEAVQGKLTKQNKNDEPADKLLQRIKAEKQKLIAAGKLKKEMELQPITEDEMLFELPKGWVWCRWNDLLSFDKYPMKRGPFGSSLKKEMFGDKGIRVFEQYNPINDDPYWARYYITEKQYKELEGFTAIPGDLLISCSGATLGRITEIPDDADFGIINQALLKLTLNKKVLSNAYFLMLFRSPFLQQKISDEAGGSAIPNMVGVSVLKQILIPLPPLSEQQRILTKVQQLLHMLNQLEQMVANSQTQAQQLLQAVLKEAFTSKSKVYEEKEMITMAAEE